MLKKKLNVNFRTYINIFSVGSIILFLVALTFKIKTLIVAGELLIILSIIGVIFGMIYSIVSKHEKQ